MGGSNICTAPHPALISEALSAINFSQIASQRPPGGRLQLAVRTRIPAGKGRGTLKHFYSFCVEFVHFETQTARLAMLAAKSARKSAAADSVLTFQTADDDDDFLEAPPTAKAQLGEFSGTFHCPQTNCS